MRYDLEGNEMPAGNNAKAENVKPCSYWCYQYLEYQFRTAPPGYGGRAKAKCLELQTQAVAAGCGTRQRMCVRRGALITIDRRQGQGCGTKSRDDTFAGQ